MRAPLAPVTSCTLCTLCVLRFWHTFRTLRNPPQPSARSYGHASHIAISGEHKRFQWREQETDERFFSSSKSEFLQFGHPAKIDDGHITYAHETSNPAKANFRKKKVLPRPHRARTARSPPSQPPCRPYRPYRRLTAASPPSHRRLTATSLPSHQPPPGRHHP